MNNNSCGMGLNVTGANVTNCTFDYNGIGISITGNNNIINCQTNYNGKGILVQGSSNIIENNTVSNNDVGIELLSGGSIVKDNNISNNILSNNNIGIYIHLTNMGSFVLNNNTYNNNTQDIAAGP
jgi:parallel beta-helix repeat protein